MLYDLYPLTEPVNLPDDPDNAGRVLVEVPFSDECGPVTPPFRHPVTGAIYQIALTQRADAYRGVGAIPHDGTEVRWDLWISQTYYQGGDLNQSYDWTYDPLLTYTPYGTPEGWHSTDLRAAVMTEGGMFENWLTLTYQTPSGDTLPYYNSGQYAPRYALDRKIAVWKGWDVGGQYGWWNAYGAGFYHYADIYVAGVPYPGYRPGQWIYAGCTYHILQYIAAPKYPGIIPLLAPLALLGSMMLLSAPPSRPPKKR